MAVLAAPLAFSQGNSDGIHFGQQARICLSIAGLDGNDVPALIGAVWGADSSNANCAAGILGLHPASSDIHQALLHATRSLDYNLVLCTGGALVSHHNYEWADDLARRFSEIEDPLHRIRIAGLLAEAGRYEGWDVIRSTIVTKQHYLDFPDEALRLVPSFAGMKDPERGPVNLVEELDRMYGIAPPEVRPSILNAMAALGPRPPGEKKVPGPPIENEE